MLQTLLSAKGEQDYTKYLYGWDSKTGFKAEHDNYYLLYPRMTRQFLKGMTGSEEIRVDSDKVPLKYAGEKKANPINVATQARLVME